MNDCVRGGHWLGQWLGYLMGWKGVKGWAGFICKALKAGPRLGNKTEIQRLFCSLFGSQHGQCSLRQLGQVRQKVTLS